ncbi:NAD(P)-binding domain-containing protein [Nonomuraea diastatica]|uniref:FAD/NAD(P)-binding domain-containing protein n=1 Tax=Nonomuraea diastatica TaxID=1848329 RepID=A0A4R4VXW2_9ACTN|nr:NAD(P)-binding domain-containing protein [Nonomuraea diastatica]TDD10958.1 hypothetical protein E1294_45905 [Nonomuraea diastatica]
MWRRLWPWRPAGWSPGPGRRGWRGQDCESRRRRAALPPPGRTYRLGWPPASAGTGNNRADHRRLAQHPTQRFLQASRFELPVQLGTTVTVLRRPDGAGFEAVTYTSDGVVVATGPFQQPHIPDLPLPPEIVSLHSSDHRSPAQLPDGPVLVVGGGNSGVQIAAEFAATQPVTLALGARQPVLPQRIDGTDVFTWLQALGLVRAPVTSRLGRRIRDRDPLIGLGPRGLRRLGVRIVDRIAGADGPLLRTASGQALG